MLWLDEYERRARLVPALLALLPISVLIAAFGLNKLPAVSFPLSVVSLGGGPVVMADMVRQFGRKAEAKLWSSWGGPPTTLELKLQGPTTNSVRRDMWRKAVESVSGIPLLSLRRETTDPARAAQTIEAAVGKIRDKTRDKQKFPLLSEENKNYGYSRNLYGFRWVGCGIAAAALLAMVAYMYWLAHIAHRPVPKVPDLASVIVSAVILVGWLIWPSKARVRSAGDRYAERLLQAATILEDEGPAATAPGASGQTPTP